MILTRVAVQKHRRNQGKKDMHLTHSWWTREHIPDKQGKIELQLINNFNNRLVSKRNEAPAHEDQIECFLKSPRADIRMLWEVERIMVCHKIRQVIYKHQMAHIQHQTMPATPFQSPRASTPSPDFSGGLGVTSPGPYHRDLFQLPSSSNF